MDIDALINDLVRREGGYSNDPNDRGGETMYGITVAEARSNGYKGKMKDMPFGFAVGVYKAKYWLKPKFDAVLPVFPMMAEKLFDFGVNCGTATASMALQRALTVLNNRGADYPDLKADGNIGPVTIDALKTFLTKRGREGREVLLFMVAAFQCVRYVEIAERDDTQEKYMFGWQAQRALFNAVP